MGGQNNDHESQTTDLDRLIEGGCPFIRERARDYLRAQPNAVEAARRLGCTCAEFSRLLSAWGLKGASLGSVKRHLADMAKEALFEEGEVLRLMTAARTARRGGQPPSLKAKEAAEPGPVGAVGPGSPKQSASGWSPRTHLSNIHSS